MTAMPGLAKIKERNINKCCSKPVVLGNEFHHTNPMKSGGMRPNVKHRLFEKVNMPMHVKKTCGKLEISVFQKQKHL